ncbi:unnamed protein product [Closterium sp. NIES-65]|nr:unnamed protein product [Closterium sp. NIES-65]
MRLGAAVPVDASHSMLGYNYLTGTLPKPLAALKALDTERNFLSGTFPTASLAYCSARGNCFLDATACFSIDEVDQRGAGCNMCGSSNGQLPMCGRAMCTPDPSAYVASEVPNSGTAPTLALKCPALPLDATSSAALLNIGAALGVTHTDWSASSGCKIIGQAIAPKSWPGVLCSGSGAVVSLVVNNLNLRGTIHADMTKLSSLTYLHVGYNLLYGRLATFVSNITPLTAIVTLCVPFRPSPRPPTLLSHSRLTAAFCTPLTSLALSLQSPRSVSAVPSLCLCSPLALSLQSPRSVSAVPSLCLCSPLALSLQSPRSVSAGPSLCICMSFFLLALALDAAAPPNLNFNYLYDSVPSTLLNMPSLTKMSAIGLPSTHVPSIPFHSPTQPAECQLPDGHAASCAHQAQVPGRQPQLLRGPFPSQAFQFCDIRSNCFYGLGTCTNPNGVGQRSSDCAICATTNATPPLCGGAPCVLNATAALAAGTVNSLGATPQPFYCGPAPIDPTAAQALLVLRAALGVTETTWLVDSPCDVAGNPPMPGSWAGVGCDTTGQVLTLSVPLALHALAPHCPMQTRPSFPDPPSFLALPNCCPHPPGNRSNMASNLLEARLGEWATALSTLKALKHLNLQFNYLTGSITGVPTAAFKTINVASNILAGSFPASSTTMCDARNNCLLDASKCVSSGSSAQRAAAACTICGGSASTVLCGGGVCAPNTATPLATKTPNSASVAVLPLVCTGVRVDPAALPILANMKTALGVPHQGWGVQTLCCVTNQLRGPDDMSGVYCSEQGTVCRPPAPSTLPCSHCLSSPLVPTANLPASPLGDSPVALMPATHSPLPPSPLPPHRDVSSNFLSGPLDPFISPLTGLTALKNLIMNYNFFSGSIPSAISAIKSLTMLSLGWNYLTGSVPVLGAAVQVLDLENNWLIGKFPATTNWPICTARANCFSDPTACKNNNQGVTQRASCAICNSADGTGTLCSNNIICQPDPAGVKASTALRTPTTPLLAFTCPPTPPVTTDATAASALMNIKTALGVTYTNWAASSSSCSVAGSLSAGGFTGVECDSLGNPVKITLDSQKLSGILHADITKLTALTSISLKSNLFRARLEEFGSRIPSLPNLAVLLLDFNWFFGSLPPAIIGMPKLTRLGLSYNYLTYRVPPVSAALKDIDVGFNFLSRSFPANTATSCGANNNCFQAVTGCTTKGTVQRSTRCSFCESSTGQGMLCYGYGVYTVDASAPFNAGTPNSAGAATLPLACVNMVCGSASPVLCPSDWRCTGLQCVKSFTNCIGYLCVP